MIFMLALSFLIFRDPAAAAAAFHNDKTAMMIAIKERQKSEADRGQSGKVEMDFC